MLEIDKLAWSPSGKQDRKFRLHVPRLSIGSGITLLAGRNGAGKTSLLHLLATAETPDEGAIRYGGLTMDRSLSAIRASIGYVPTDVSLYEEMTVVRLLRYMAQLKGAVGEQMAVEPLLEQFRLVPYRSRKIKTLAQGIRHRIALAQAWIGKPAYLFLDEPLNALDSLERLLFIRQLADYARSRTVIVSTHELNEWEAWANRVIWLDEGRVRFHGHIAEWLGGLPASVWEGTLSEEQYRAIDASAVLRVRAEDGLLRVSMVSVRPPRPDFAEQTPTMEDAYFIRCRFQAPYSAG